jgi:hypothetical protein
MYSFQQVRARLVAAALSSLGRAGIVDALRQCGSFPRLGDDLLTDRSLAYRLAWLLLPAGITYVKCEPADLDWNAVQIRTDAGTGRKGGYYVR